MLLDSFKEPFFQRYQNKRDRASFCRNSDSLVYIFWAYQFFLCLLILITPRIISLGNQSSTSWNCHGSWPYGVWFNAYIPYSYSHFD